MAPLLDVILRGREGLAARGCLQGAEAGRGRASSKGARAPPGFIF